MKLNICIFIIIVSLLLQVSCSLREGIHKVKSERCNLWTGKVLPDDIIKNIVQLHNEYRNKIAEGNQNGKNQIPAAGNMRQMYWSNAIAEKAQAWADSCKFTNSNPEFRKHGNMRLGENIFMIKSKKKKLDSPEQMKWDNTIKEWYKEKKQFDSTHINPFKLANKVDHFTQLAWADSYLFGCGYSASKDEKFFKGVYVCQYGPAGNFDKHMMFKKGKPCSHCPEGTSCSKGFSSLCCINGHCEKERINEAK